MLTLLLINHLLELINLISKFNFLSLNLLVCLVLQIYFQLINGFLLLFNQILHSLCIIKLLLDNNVLVL
jgi:hypothetical protein